ncbi:MAG: pseudouridine synthase [bacterium]
MKLFRFLQIQAGVSRRKALDLVLAGEVTVNGERVLDPFLLLTRGAVTRLALRGHPLSIEPREARVYRLYKPAGMLCSHDDPFSGNTVGRLLRADGFLGYTWVGRLDQDAEGLLLLSNDGDVIQAFTHPRYEVHKVYRVWLAESPPERELDRALRSMECGVEDEGEVLRILDGRVEGRPRHAVITLAEGRKHEIKRLFARFDYSVSRLLRVAVGPVQLGDLAPGAWDRLPLPEEASLVDLARTLLARAGETSDRDLLADDLPACRKQVTDLTHIRSTTSARPVGDPGDATDANLLDDTHQVGRRAG